MIWTLRRRSLEFPRRPLVMGIVNINDDSFCGDGSVDPRVALRLAADQILAGAEIIDLGAESARTNRGPISPQEEIDRLAPVIEAWPTLLAGLGAFPDGEPLLSINTWRPEVIRAILPIGGDLINDLSALPTSENASLCAEFGASLLIMHSQGEPKVSHRHVGYADVWEELESFFENRLRMAREAGLREEAILLDPGIDFAKQRADNLRIYRDLERLHRLGRPILLPVSRKTVIGEVLGLEDPLERDVGTVACIAAGMRRGAHIFRVHRVAAAVQAVRMLYPLTS